MAMMDSVMAMSGSTLPQASSNGGHIAMTYHIVTTVREADCSMHKSIARLPLFDY